MFAYPFVYTRVTAHNEFDLIRANEPAAAIALGLSLLGFVLPLVSAIAHSANVWDCLIWAAIALIVQIIVYYLVRVPVPKLSDRIASGELAVQLMGGQDRPIRGVVRPSGLQAIPARAGIIRGGPRAAGTLVTRGSHIDAFPQFLFD